MSAQQLLLFPGAPTPTATHKARSTRRPLLVSVRVQPGDIWQMGPHRLLCGDATLADNVALLMDGAKASMLLTDPPYGMRLDTDFSSMKGSRPFMLEKGVTGGRRYAHVVGDHGDFSAQPIVKMFHAVPEQFWFGADYYAVTLGDTMHSGSWLIWDKRCNERFDRMYGSCFEMIWSRKRHKRDILRHVWAGIFGTEKEPQRGRVHPTQKPVALFEDILTRYSKPQMLVVDPYLGSGTTLIACERTGRTCYGVEIEPQYCDIILARWEHETGQRAVLLDRKEVAA